MQKGGLICSEGSWGAAEPGLFLAAAGGGVGSLRGVKSILAGQEGAPALPEG